MITVLSKRVVNWLVSSETVADEDREIYEYAVYCSVISLAPIFIICIVSFIFGEFVRYMFFLIPFISIRKFSGGFHAGSTLRCFAASCVTLHACLFFMMYVPHMFWHDIFGAVSALGLAVLSPVDSPNKRLSCGEKVMYRRIVILTICILCVVITAMSCIGMYETSKGMVMAVILSFILLLPCMADKEDKDAVSCVEK